MNTTHARGITKQNAVYLTEVCRLWETKETSDQEQMSDDLAGRGGTAKRRETQ